MKHNIELIISIMKNYAKEKGINQFTSEKIVESCTLKGSYELEKQTHNEINEKNYKDILKGSLKKEKELKLKIFYLHDYESIHHALRRLERDELDTTEFFPILLEKLFEKYPEWLGKNKQEDKVLYHRLIKKDPRLIILKDQFFSHIEGNDSKPIRSEEIKCRTYEIDNENFYEVLKVPCSPYDFWKKFQMFFCLIDRNEIFQVSNLLLEKKEESIKFTAINYQDKILLDTYIQQLPAVFSKIDEAIDFEPLKMAQSLEEDKEQKLKIMANSLFIEIKMQLELKEKETKKNFNKI